jgi:hypothetical protein
MLTKILLPHTFQKIGWIMILPCLILLFMSNYHEFELSFFDIPLGESVDHFFGDSENFTNEIALFGIFISLFFTAFSKKYQEDEYIQKPGLDSLLIACYTYSILLVLATVFLYGFAFLDFMGYNLFLLQVIFIIRFRWVLFNQKKNLLAL